MNITEDLLQFVDSLKLTDSSPIMVQRALST